MFKRLRNIELEITFLRESFDKLASDLRRHIMIYEMQPKERQSKKGSIIIPEETEIKCCQEGLENNPICGCKK